jgi:hypothetical protein
MILKVFLLLSLLLCRCACGALNTNRSGYWHIALSEEDIDYNKTYHAASRWIEQHPLMRRIALFGDSMLKTPDKYFKMYNMLIRSLKKRLNTIYPEDPTFGNNFNIDISGMRMAGGRMADMNVIFKRQVLEWDGRQMTKPKVALIYLSSDLADARDLIKNNKDKALMHQLLKEMLNAYRISLTAVVTNIKAYNITYQIIMGPTAFESKGELPEYWTKQGWIDSFVKINKEVCAELGAIHLDSRSLFKSSILNYKKSGKRDPIDLKAFVGKHWPDNIKDNSTYGGIFTIDGEHSNYEGTKVLVESMANAIAQLDIWGSPEEVHEIAERLKLEKENKGKNTGRAAGSIYTKTLKIILKNWVYLIFLISAVAAIYTKWCKSRGKAVVKVMGGQVEPVV